MAQDSSNGNKDSKGLFGGINDIRKKSGITFTFVIFAALNIAMMVIGVQTMDQCPLEPMIPTYLIVAGSTSLSLLLVRLVVSHALVPYLEHNNILEQVEEGGDPKTKGGKAMSLVWRALNVYDSLASIFSTCWLIVGSVYVYGATTPQHIGDEELKYCDYTVYMFAFIVITVGYVSLVLSIFAAVCHCIMRSKE